MTLDEYQRLAAVTANTGLSPDERLTTAAMGLIGEAGEVVDELKKILGHGHAPDRSKLLKELGDVMWYLAEICTVRGHQLSAFVGSMSFSYHMESFPDCAIYLSHHASMAALCVVELRATQDASGDLRADAPLRNQVRETYAYLLNLCEILGLSLLEILDANIKKLRDRYGDGFTEQASINRRDRAGVREKPSPSPSELISAREALGVPETGEEYPYSGASVSMRVLDDTDHGPSPESACAPRGRGRSKALSSLTYELACIYAQKFAQRYGEECKTVLWLSEYGVRLEVSRHGIMADCGISGPGEGDWAKYRSGMTEAITLLVEELAIANALGASEEEVAELDPTWWSRTYRALEIIESCNDILRQAEGRRQGYPLPPALEEGEVRGAMALALKRLKQGRNEPTSPEEQADINRQEE